MKSQYSKEELINLVKKQTPALEWCNDYFWNKYGYFYFGIGDRYAWKEEALNNSSKEELWKIVALCSNYWKKQYQEWDERKSNELRRVYDFATEIRNIFNIKDCSYESNFRMLDVALDYIKNRNKNK